MTGVVETKMAVVGIRQNIKFNTKLIISRVKKKPNYFSGVRELTPR